MALGLPQLKTLLITERDTLTSLRDSKPRPMTLTLWAVKYVMGGDCGSFWLAAYRYVVYLLSLLIGHSLRWLVWNAQVKFSLRETVWVMLFVSFSG